jgi:hypothetical protein
MLQAFHYGVQWAKTIRFIRNLAFTAHALNQGKNYGFRNMNTDVTKEKSKIHHRHDVSK